MAGVSVVDRVWTLLGRRQEQAPPARREVDPLDFWRDPDPHGIPGILLSDRIRLYVDRANLIYPFDEAALRPAAYTLHVGSEYLMSLPGKRLVEGDLEKEGQVVIPPNGLIY